VTVYRKDAALEGVNFAIVDDKSSLLSSGLRGKRQRNGLGYDSFDTSLFAREQRQQSILMM
jgi:hypothetical protein